MAYSINEKIRELKPYNPIEGNYRIRLDANESFLTPPPEILRKIKDAAAAVEFNRYPDPYAQALCAAFAGYYGVDPENVAAGNGSDELISILAEAFLMKGEAILTLSPDFSMYRFYGSLDESKCCEFQKNSDFTVNVDALIRMVKDCRARMLIFSNPCNPTSLGLCREEVRRLIRSVDCLVVLDEAYMDFWNQSLLGEVNEYDNLVILRTCSKAAGMAGIRLGFAVACQKLIRLLKAVKSPYNVNSVTQKIGTIVLSEKEWLTSCTKKIMESKEYLYGLVKKYQLESKNDFFVPESVTNFVTICFPEANEVFHALLKKGIAVRCFNGFLRITAGTREEDDEFFQAFREIMNQRKG